MNIIEKAISYFTPYDCVICGQEGSPLCYECAEKLPTQIEVCFICGKASRNFKTCPKCINRYKPQRVWACSVYKDDAKTVVTSLKFDGKRSIAADMANQIDSVLPYFVEPPIITYVPTASNHRRQRGFDHAQLLTKEVAKLRRWHIATLLVRQSKVRQLGAKREIRKAQLMDAFRPINQEMIKKAHILLIDDVVTTGATLEVCAKELIKAGAAQVDAAVFARTPKNR